MRMMKLNGLSSQNAGLSPNIPHGSPPRGSYSQSEVESLCEDSEVAPGEDEDEYSSQGEEDSSLLEESFDAEAEQLFGRAAP